MKNLIFCQYLLNWSLLGCPKPMQLVWLLSWSLNVGEILHHFFNYQIKSNQSTISSFVTALHQTYGTNLQEAGYTSGTADDRPEVLVLFFLCCYLVAWCFVSISFCCCWLIFIACSYVPTIWESLDVNWNWSYIASHHRYLHISASWEPIGTVILIGAKVLIDMPLLKTLTP